MINKKRTTVTIGLLVLVSMGIVVFGFTSDTRVADAAMAGDIASVRSLLREAADANSSHNDGMTALHWAAMNGDAEMAQLLLYAGATVKAGTRIGNYTPLYLAARGGYADVMEVLLKAGADAKVPAIGGVTPLMMAASSGNPETVKLLMEHGADVNSIETVNGQSALSFAAAFDRPEAIKTLVRYGANVDHKSKFIKREPIQRDDEDGQMQGQQPPEQGPSGQRGQRGQRGGQEQQAQQNEPAGQPAPTGQQQAGQQPGQQPEQQQAGQQQAGQGQRGGRGSAPPDPTRAGGNPKGELTPLMYAARQGNLAATTAILDSGANINLWSADGSTALMLAVMNGQYDLAKLLIERGADVRIITVDWSGPLYALVNIQWSRKTFHPQPTTKYQKTHYLDLMKLMLEKGADPNIRLKKDLWYIEFNFSLENTNAAGTTAFWKCAAVADIDCMKLLVSRGADPNIASIDNITPFLAAAGAGFHGNDEVTTSAGRLAAVKYLVEELKSDVNAVDGREIPAAEGRRDASSPQSSADRPQSAPQGQPQAEPGQRGAPTQQTAQGQRGGGTQPQQQAPQMQRPQQNQGGFTALHAAAARGDNDMILYLVSKGAKIDAVSRNGSTVVDMANGPRQRIQPFRETIALLVAMGAKNSHKCVSC